MSKNKKSQGNIGGGAKQFLVWHGEKFVVAAIAVLALWLAMQGLGGYQTLSWQPRELEETAEAARRAIENSERTVEDEELRVFNYAGHAEQIKREIKVDLYRNPLGSEWNPTLEPSRTQTGSGVTSPESSEATESEPSQDES